MEMNYNLGTQPLEAVLSERDLKNSELVEASTEHLTHKMVQKGRKGRRLTRNVQDKIITALNALSEEHSYTREDLFNYKGH